QRLKDRGVAEIPVRSRILRTLLALGTISVAASGRNVVREGLIGPQYLPGLQVESDDRVGGLGGGLRKGVSRCHVNGVALGVDGRRGPNGSAGRTPELRAEGVLLRRLRLLGDRVRLPDGFSGVRVER